MSNKNRDIIKYAKKLGINLKVDPSLNKFAGKVLFPKKLEMANNVLANLIEVNK